MKTSKGLLNAAQIKGTRLNNILGINLGNERQTNTQQVFTFSITNCNSDNSIAYSTSSTFTAGILIYQDVNLTIPHTGALGALGLSEQQVYNIDINGLVYGSPFICN